MKQDIKLTKVRHGMRGQRWTYRGWYPDHVDAWWVTWNGTTWGPMYPRAAAQRYVRCIRAGYDIRGLSREEVWCLAHELKHGRSTVVSRLDSVPRIPGFPLD